MKSDMTRFDSERLHQLIANHASYMDIPALFASLPKLPYFS